MFCVFICQRLIITYTFRNSYKELDILPAIAPNLQKCRLGAGP